MSLSQTLDTAFKESMKSKDSLKVSVLRMIRTAVKNKEVELRRSLDDDEILKVLSTQAKQRKEAIEQFLAGNRHDLAEKEQAELKILHEFLPQALSREEMERELDDLISALAPVGPKDMGKVMKEAMRRFAGRADGKEVNELVRSKLAG